MPKKPLSIYIHWPFCVSKCPYCDFNSHVRPSIDEERWERFLVKDLKSFYEDTKDFEVVSIFFGGGTPSLMPSRIVKRLIQEIKDSYETSSDMEITLEANPNSVEVKNFEALSRAGVNRVSLGVQSFNDKDLKFLGRVHSRDEALQAIQFAKENFSRYSFDLIYTLPDQCLEDWQKELESALSLAGGHLSLYQLTIEEGTPFYLAAHRGDFSMPAEEQSEAFLSETYNIMSSHGYEAYEVSNFAQPGQECRHNQQYWFYDDYIGIGPGAHSRLAIGGIKHALRRHRSPEKWMEMVEGGEGTHERFFVEGKLLLEEYLMMRLRIQKPLEQDEFLEKTGLEMFSAISQEKVKGLQKEGLLISDKNLSLSPKGRKLLNGVLRFLF